MRDHEKFLNKISTHYTNAAKLEQEIIDLLGSNGIDLNIALEKAE